MSLRELKHLKRLSSAELNSPRKLRPRRNAKQEGVAKPFQDAVFSIPELQAHITAFLMAKDLVAMMSTCLAWFSLCAPVLYKTLSLQDHKNTGMPNIEKYGIYVQHLRLDFANTLLEPMFHSFGLLHSLRTLHWSARGSLIHVIHVDEILGALQSCPRLVSLHLGEVNVVYSGHASKAPQTPINTHYPSPPGSPEPMVDEDYNTLYSGHQLQELTLGGTKITDEGLLRLLGIEVEQVYDISRESPALTRLDVNSDRLTHKSGARILQECSRLEVMRVQSSKMASLELFQSDAIWPSAPLIKELSLDFKVPDMDASFYLQNLDWAKISIPKYSTGEQKLIWSRLQSMISLRNLEISGYPIDFRVVDDMSFARQLETASVHLLLRRTDVHDDEKEAVVAKGDEWLSRNQGWSCHLHDGAESMSPRLEITYRKDTK
ncbi:hypothetical protein BG006_011288 [Podila minutissima]|uniref:F-box domain-containing protein n=1 Tax=Podila minutissima TaxID=64525 RepID=A0A9P5SC01_9FUNG|nr:hypothetical protein BG006_011288 [Podila minutissima]